VTRSDLKRAVLSGLAAASLLNLAMFDSWKMILDPVRSATLWYRPTAEACLAAVAVCALAFLTGALLATAMGPAPSRVVRVVSDLFLLSSSLLILNLVPPAVLLPQHDSWFLPVAGLLLVLLSLRWHRRLAHGFYLLLLLLSPFLLVTAGRAGLVALTADFATLDHTVPSLGLTRPRPGVRVVVLVFDEMDFNYAFPSRPASLRLPAFDSLRRHAFFAMDAHAPARSTRSAIPSYLIGREVDSAIAGKPGEYLARVVGDSIPLDINVEPGMFDDATLLGARSAVVGYHVPYCGLAFARLLEHCTWRPNSRGGVLDGRIGLPRAVLRQLSALLLIGISNRAAQEDRIRYLEDAALRAASDSALRLVFVHLPLPHFPPVWDEQHGRFTWTQFHTSGYFDNLALADHVLSRILAATQQSGLQEQTVFVVTSDHSWRGGSIDGIPPGTTVPFMVRFPNGAGREWTPRFETVRLRALVSILLTGDVHDEAGLAVWAAFRQTLR